MSFDSDKLAAEIKASSDRVVASNILLAIAIKLGANASKKDIRAQLDDYKNCFNDALELVRR
jgi:hypothetical protein